MFYIESRKILRELKIMSEKQGGKSFRKLIKYK